MSLLRPHHESDDSLFLNRKCPDPYNFSTPDNTEWFVKEITAHQWLGCNMEFEVKWSLEDTTWESLSNCNELAALDNYLALMGASNWKNLPRCTVGNAYRQS